MMKSYEVLKNSSGRGYTLIISRNDGTQNDYRFNSKSELNRWMKLAGLN